MPDDLMLMHARRCVQDASSRANDALRTILQSREVLETSRRLLGTVQVPRSAAEVFFQLRGSKSADR
ncbi:hypothetical protein [Roseomonas sp. WA12]